MSSCAIAGFVLRPAWASRRRLLWLGLLLAGLPVAAQGQAQRVVDRIDITGRQNLTLGSGARAYGMGGAFLARADDATAASWNPAGLSYLRTPELSLVGAFNSIDLDARARQRHVRGHRPSTSPRSRGRSASARCAAPSS